MFGGEKDPDNGDKVDVIVEVLTITITPSSMCTVYFTILCQVCGHSSVVKKGVARLRPGGVAVLVGCSRYYLNYPHSIYTLQVGCVTPDTPLELTGDTLVRGCVTLIGVHNYEHRDLVTAVQVTLDT